MARAARCSTRRPLWHAAPAVARGARCVPDTGLLLAVLTVHGVGAWTGISALGH